MTKHAALEHIEVARRSHIKWLNRAISMTRGSSAIRDPHPLASTACQFGIWFNDEGKNLYEKLGTDGFSKIHLLHDKLHEKYLNIYEIYFGSAEGVAYNQKAVLTKNTISKAQEEEAQAHMAKLRKLSYLMLEELTELQEEVKKSALFDIEAVPRILP